MIHVSQNEWKFLAIIFLITVFFAFVPIVIGYLLTPQHHVFSFQSIVNLTDYPVYFSYIEQVKAGQLLFKNLFTSESQSMLVFNPFWLGVGLFAKVLSLSYGMAFHLARLLLTPILLVIAYYLVALFFEDEFKRKVCFLFLLFSSSVVFVTPESFVFQDIYQSPHIIASLALIILIFIFSILAFEKYKFIYSLSAGLFSLALVSFHPYNIPTIFGVLFVFIVVDMVKIKKINFNYIQHYLFVVLFSLPPILYYIWQFKYNPIFHQWTLQNVTLTPPPFPFLIGYGLLIPLSALGIYCIFRENKLSQKNLFLIVWLLVQVLLIYFPMRTQRRLLNGLEVPMAILAVFGLFYLLNVLKNRKFFSFFNFSNNDMSLMIIASFLILPLSWSNIYIIKRDIGAYANKNLGFSPDSSATHKYMYISKEKVSAMTWMKNNTSEASVVFSSFDDSSLITYLSLRKVFAGNSFETIQLADKERQVKIFYKEQDSSKRSAFLKDNHIDYVFVGPEERDEFSFNPDSDVFLKKVYRSDAYTIYKVN